MITTSPESEINMHVRPRVIEKSVGALRTALATSVLLLVGGDQAYASPNSNSAKQAGSLNALAFDAQKALRAGNEDVPGNYTWVRRESFTPSTKDCEGDVPTARCVWELRPDSTEKIPGSFRRKYRSCVSFDKSDAPLTVFCSKSRAESITTSAKIGGSIAPGIEIAQIDAEVGYEATKTRSVESGGSTRIPAGKGPGSLMVAAVYNQTRKLTQERVPCYQGGGNAYAYNNCYFAKNPAPENIKYIVTQKYSRSKYKVRYNK